jgi:DNA-binding response OmpR family regulator
MTGGVSVLVVDDEPAIRLLCRVNLELDGHRVLEAASLEEAREALADGPSLVLLDLQLGAEDGLELLTEIRADWPDVKVVLLTGTSESTDVLRGLADGFLAKPFSLDQLAFAVEQFARV